MLFKPSFARNLSLKIAIASTILLFSVLFFVTIVQATITIKNCAANLDSQLKLSAEVIESQFNTIQKFGDNTALMIDHIPTDSSSFRNTLTKLLKTNPDIFGISVYLNPKTATKSGLAVPMIERSEDGEKVVFYPSFFKYDPITSKQVFESTSKTAKSNKWYGPYYAEVRDIFELSYLTESEMVEKGYGCIVETVVTMDWLVNSLKSLKPVSGAEAYIIDEEGKIICSSDKEMSVSVLEHPDDSTSNQLIENGVTFNKDNLVVSDGVYYNKELKYDADTTHTSVDFDLNEVGSYSLDTNNKTSGLDLKNSRLTRKSELSNGWTLCVACPLDEVFGDVKKSLSSMGLGMLLSIILLFFFCTRIIYKKARPLKQFAQASQSIAKGDFDAKLPIIKRKDEIRQLRDSFENMQISLKKYIADLAETTAENQRMESELNIAAEIQSQALRTKFPKDEKFGLYAAMHAAKEVGGDFYDYVHKGNLLYFCIGDVSGKGVPAALLMMTTTMMFRYVCSTSDKSLSEMVSIINNSVADGNDSGFFVTMFVACIDLDTKMMKYCNAGHNEMIIVKPDGEASFNKAVPNIACGLFPDFKYQDQSIKLETGERVILYTDGVNEAMNLAQEEFGNGRLIDWANSSAYYFDEKSLVEGLFSSLNTFKAGAQQSDDITILSIKIK